MPCPSTGDTWTDVTIDELRALWSDGHSTAEIGRRLGVSKNAVVGKAHRLDLPSRPSPIRNGGSRTPRPVPRPTVPKLADIMPIKGPEQTHPVRPTAPEPAFPPHRQLTAPPSAPRPAATATRSCCWPLGQPGTAGFRFCADDAMAGKPYCETHCSLAYRRIRRREDLIQTIDV